MARLLREDELGACQLELANGRMLRLAQLRWVCCGVLPQRFQLCLLLQLCMLGLALPAC